MRFFFAAIHDPPKNLMETNVETVSRAAQTVGAVAIVAPGKEFRDETGLWRREDLKLDVGL